MKIQASLTENNELQINSGTMNFFFPRETADQIFDIIAKEKGVAFATRESEGCYTLNIPPQQPLTEKEAFNSKITVETHVDENLKGTSYENSFFNVRVPISSTNEAIIEAVDKYKKDTYEAKEILELSKKDDTPMGFCVAVTSENVKSLSKLMELFHGKSFSLVVGGFMHTNSLNTFLSVLHTKQSLGNDYDSEEVSTERFLEYTNSIHKYSYEVFFPETKSPLPTDELKFDLDAIDAQIKANIDNPVKYCIGVDQDDKMLSYTLVMKYDGKTTIVLTKTFKVGFERLFRGEIENLSNIFNAEIIKEVQEEKKEDVFTSKRPLDRYGNEMFATIGNYMTQCEYQFTKGFIWDKDKQDYVPIKITGLDESPKTYTEEDMRKCFNDSRNQVSFTENALPHTKIEFETFDDYLKTLK